MDIRSLEIIVQTQKPEIWKELLYNRLKGQSKPVLVSDSHVISASALWFYIRYWTKIFRQSGFKSNQTILLHTFEGLQFPILFLAALSENYRIIVANPNQPIQKLISHFEPDIVISQDKNYSSFLIDKDLLSIKGYYSKKNSSFLDEISFRFAIKTSSTTGKEKWIFLSDKNLASVLQTHIPKFPISDGTRILSILPHFHIFGLVLDFLLGIFSGAEIIRDIESGRDIHRLLYILDKFKIDHLSTVPLLIQRISDLNLDYNPFKSLSSGLIGGAPISENIVQFLSETKFRVGYGQTEACPGVTMGNVGEFCANYIGNPIGCEIKIEENILYYRGNNVCTGIYESGFYKKIPENIWFCSNDMVVRQDDKLIFNGRSDYLIKLSNGQFLNPFELETNLYHQIKELDLVLVKNNLNGQFNIYFFSENNIGTLKQKITQTISHIQKYCNSITYKAKSDWVISPKGDVNRNIFN